MNCPACGAPMKLGSTEDSMTCAYCHSVYFPEKNDDGVRVLGAAEGESCPVCAIGLQDAALERVRLRYCTRCRGMLVPMDSFADLIDAVRARREGAIPAGPQTANDEELRRRLACPHCHQPLTMDFYAGANHVVIGSCEGCALDWVDHGKLEQIALGVDVFRE